MRTDPRRILTALTLGALLLTAGAALAQPARPGIRPGIRQGEPAPPFSMTTLDGKRLTPDSLKGKVVLLDFWATWCVPCIRALPELKQLTQKTKGAPFVLVSVSVDEDRAMLDQFIRQYGMSWPQVWDYGMPVTYGLFQITTFPTYVLIDHEGRVSFRFTGFGGSSGNSVEAAVLKAIEAAKKGGPPKSEPAR